MTTDPIDRALERLEVITEGNFDHTIRPILTDLAAEKYNEGMEYGSILRCRDLKARLAAVVYRSEEAQRSNSLGHSVAVADHLKEILALARGEGYEASTAETNDQQNATSEGGEQAPTGTSTPDGIKPAAPDATLDEIEQARMEAILPLKDKYLGNDLTLLEALAMAWDADRIYLQVEENEVSWCADKIHDTDVPYIREDLHHAQMVCDGDRFATAEARLAAVRELRARYEHGIPVHELDAILDGKEAEDR